MNITIVAVGKSLSGAAKQLADEYQQRLVRDHTVQWQLMPASLSQDPETCRAEESQQLLKILKPTDKILLLDERGVQQTNQQFAATFENFAGSHGRMIFIIGGAYGVTDIVRQRADFVWSLSLLVFPHQLVKVMLLEQLYRTTMVQKGHPYHHV